MQQRAPTADAHESTAPAVGGAQFLEQGSEQVDGPHHEVEEPARLLRIASTVQALLHEVRTTDLDQAARERLADIHNRMVGDLSQIVSEELIQELEGLALQPEQDTPSGAELRVMQAQLAGWLQGLLHGIHASIATQQLVAQQQLARMRAQQAEGRPGGQPGQYL